MVIFFYFQQKFFFKTILVGRFDIYLKAKEPIIYYSIYFQTHGLYIVVKQNKTGVVRNTVQGKRSIDTTV